MARASLFGFVLVLVLLGFLSTSWARLHVDEPPRGSTGSRSKREMEKREQEGRERDPGSRGRSRHGEEERGQLRIELGEAREVLQSDGGRLRVWSEEIDAIRNTHVGIAELELEQDGLLVPQYADSDKIGYVLQGSGRMGAVIPGAQSEFRRTFVRRVERGDVIALPKGTVYWWYNDGNERHRVLCTGDTSFGANPGCFHQFGLAGSQQARFGSLLHGFSQETLATAWGVDEQTIESLLGRQNDAGIVKAKQKIRFPEMPHERRPLVEEEENTLTYYDRSARSSYFEELKYSIRRERPDLFVENGGWLSIVNNHKLPALRQVGFSAIKVSLEKNAMTAPSFVRNAHQLLYITRGNGRVQVASGDGQSVFDEDVREGTVLAIPQFFPSLKIAGDQGLEWINLLTSDGPSFTFLAGRNSAYRGIPKQVIAAAFNVDEDMVKELGRDEEVIFPARKGGRGRHEDIIATEKKQDEQQGGGERGREEQKRREQEEQHRREEEQRHRKEEEQKRRHEREREEEEQRKREQEQQRHRREEEQRHRREREEEEQRRHREQEEGERRKHNEELPAWALASLQLL